MARGLGRLLRWLILLSAGAALGYFGQDTLEMGLASLRKLLAG